MQTSCSVMGQQESVEGIVADLAAVDLETVMLHAGYVVSSTHDMQTAVTCKFYIVKENPKRTVTTQAECTPGHASSFKILPCSLFNIWSLYIPLALIGY